MGAGQELDTAAWQARSLVPTEEWALKPIPARVWQDKLPGLDNDFRPQRAISTFPMPQRAVLQARDAQEAALRPGVYLSQCVSGFHYIHFSPFLQSSELCCKSTLAGLRPLVWSLQTSDR